MFLGQRAKKNAVENTEQKYSNIANYWATVLKIFSN